MNFLHVTLRNDGEVFSRFFFIVMPILLVLHFPGSVEADIGQGEKLNGHLMAYCVGNIRTKNYENLVTYVHFRIENVCDFF